MLVSNAMDILEELAWRGQIYQQTDAEGFHKHLVTPRRVYCGFDPTADSLTIGNLVPILLLRRFQLAGHVPVVVLGGGTGRIGDPSGKEAERQLRDEAQLEHNVARQRLIFERLLDFAGSHAALLLDNMEWLGKLTFIEALRDVGKHFSVNMMIQKESVRERLHGRDQGISYTEFSYMLLQAYDFLHLFEAHRVTAQVAGSDQWGNIVGGIDLIRRKHRAEAFGLTVPLVTKADGGKFGKTESGAIWLSADRTSPYAFYQFWLNTADADLAAWLRSFTLLPQAQIDALLAESARSPQERAAQRALADHVTELVHGRAGVEHARAVSAALFSGDVRQLSRQTLDEVFAQAPTARFTRERLAGEGLPAVDLLVEAGVCKSKREARELLSSGAVHISARKAELDTRLDLEWLMHGEVLLIRRGKKSWHVALFG
jgi:tyrosyl-tRNA synthetase